MPLDLIAGWNITNPDPIDTRHVVTQSSDRYGFSFARIHNGLTTFESESQEYYILANSASYTNAAGWSRVYTSDPGGMGLSISGSLFVGSGSEGSITASVAISASNHISGGNSFHLLRAGGGGTSGIKLDAGVLGGSFPTISPQGDATQMNFGDSTTGYNFDFQRNKLSFDSDATNTFIQADSFDPESLNINADQDIHLNPDRAVDIFAGPSTPQHVATFGIASSSFMNFLEASESLSVSGTITASSLIYVKDETTNAGGLLLYGGTGLTTSPYISPQGVAAFTLRFGKTTSGYNFDFGNNKISFDSDQTNTYIQANTADPEDLEIHADHDILLKADHDTVISSSVVIKGDIEGGVTGVSDFKIVNLSSAANTTIFGATSRATTLSGTEVTVTPSLTASNDISASGDIYAQNFYVDTLVATHLSSSTLTSSFVSASTLEVRSITASDSTGILGGITASNIFANESLATNLGSSIKVISRDGDDLVELAENSSAGGGEKRGKLIIKDHNRSGGVTTAIFICPNGDNFISSSDDSGFGIGSITPRGKFSVHDKENPTITVQDERTSLTGVTNDPYELGRYRFKSNESSLSNDTLAAFELVSWDQFVGNTTKSSQLRYVDHPRGSSSDYKTLLLSANHGLVIQKDQDYPSSDSARIQTEERNSLLTLKGFDGSTAPSNAAATSSLFGGGEKSFLGWRGYSTSGYENYIDITNKGVEYKNTYDFSIDVAEGDVVDAETGYNSQYRVPIFITGSNAYAKGDGNLHNSYRPLFKIETTCGYNYRLEDPSEFYHAYISTLQELRATTHDVSWGNYKHNGTNNSGYLNYILFTTKIKGQPGSNGLDVAGAIRLDTDGGSTNGSGVSIVWFDPSDERLKTNIKDTKYGLSDLLKIKVRDFDWWKDKSQPKPSGSHSTGFIAQELHEVYPKAVNLSTGDDPRTDPSMVSPSKLIPLLVQAVQDQQKIIDNLQEEINLLKTKIK